VSDGDGSEDDDWFTRALREDDGEDDGEDDTATEGDGAASWKATDGPEDDEADGDGTGPFTEDFATAFRNAPDPEGEGGFGPSDGDEGFGGFGPSDGDEGFAVDEADFESDIDRVEVGIRGLDEMVLGGVPARSLMAVVGSAGTGKTTFGLQFLHHGLQRDERAVYITLEESRESILATADEKGWEFSAHADSDRLAVVDLDPVEMANSLASLQSDLPDLVAEFGATRLVLDSVSLLEMMYDHPARRRSEVFEFSRSLKRAGVTTVVTSEASPDSAYATRYGIIEYLADAVFVLQYVRPSDFRETRLAVEIQKIRDAHHSRETKPYDITDEGIDVHRRANIF
jgi:KaiC domain protein